MYIESSGDWGRLITRPLVMLDSTFSMNAAAPTGEVVIQLTDIESRPIEGFTFEEFLPMKFDDQLRFPLRWSNASIQSLVGRIIRMEVRLRHARLYAIRGHLHFIDAQDRWLIEDGKPLPIT